MRLHSRSLPKKTTRQGVALLMTLFVLMFVSLMLVNIADTTTLNYSIMRNKVGYEQAIALSNAGIHHVAAKLEQDDTWRGTLVETMSPTTSYTVTCVDSTISQQITVTSTGTSGPITRKVQAEISL